VAVPASHSVDDGDASLYHRRQADADHWDGLAAAAGSTGRVRNRRAGSVTATNCKRTEHSGSSDAQEASTCADALVLNARTSEFMSTFSDLQSVSP